MTKFEFEERVKWWNETTQSFEFGTFHRYGATACAVVVSDISGIKFISQNSLLRANDFGVTI